MKSNGHVPKGLLVQMGEFEVINRFFKRTSRSAVLGIGDDAALIAPTAGHHVVLSADMLVEGRHFFPDADPFLLGQKTLAVNLSDLAAMGATPRWALLSLALPEVNEPWLAAFSEGFFQMADTYGVELIGGDTTRGPLTLSVQIIGEVPIGQALTRHGGQVGDEIWISGVLGKAALGLKHLLKEIVLPESSLESCLAHLHSPVPRVLLGTALRGVASAALDISDGLLSDLGHLCRASGCGAILNLSDFLRPVSARDCPEPFLSAALLTGGDDYELCFTASPENHAVLTLLGASLGFAFQCVGELVEGEGVRVRDKQGNILSFDRSGHDHFA